MAYEVKNVKSWEAMEGVGTNCDLYRDGKKVARCHDDGNGGPWNHDWLDHDKPKVSRTITPKHGKSWVIRMTPEQALFHEFCKGKKYPPDELFPEGLEMDEDGVVSEMCDQFEQRKRDKVFCRGKTVYRIQGKTYAKDEWNVAKIPFSPETKRLVESRHGSCEFMNERI